MRKKLLFIALAVLVSGVSYSQNANSDEPDFNHWSIDAGIGLTKPYRNMAPGYGTATPDFLSGELGARYMFNEFFGVKAGLGYNNFQEKDGLMDFTTKQYQFDVQGVVGVGRLLHFETWTQTFNLLAHAGLGVGWLDYDNISDGDHVGTAKAGFTGMAKLSDRVSLNIDGSMGYNGRQNRTFDGRVTRNDEPFVFTGTIGISYYLGKNETHADWFVRGDEYAALLDSRIAALEEQIQKSRAEDAKKVQEGDDKLNTRVDELDSKVDGLSNKEVDMIEQLINEGYVNIFFDFNSSEIDKGATDAINVLRTYMKKNPGVNVNLVGYADEKGPEDYNKKLSTKRAEAVADVLVKAGIEKSRLNTEGRGEDTSVDEGSPNARQLARRVTFSIR
ncbi:OmpA family protein [uncultured Sunxiuqinia sp.]|jgi:OmpA-OmpF porin, OOP family|uniref:OmpA family protein n=1 Tax=uncultured Sunxiuqinia sp. TaxID=1573825 RepID=UPI0030DD7085|tara:strand:+ start:19189 stop:20355 length:1167 start_codon:yes stop_codon:yes gene_type:complete